MPHHALLVLRPPSVLLRPPQTPPPPGLTRHRGARCHDRPVTTAAASSPGRASPSAPSSPSPPAPPPPPLRRPPSSSQFARLREIEVLHARWAMLGVVGVIFSDSPALFSAAAWRDAASSAAASGPGGAALFGGGLAALAAVEVARFFWGGEGDAEQRAYPAATARGNRLFDPLGLFRQRRRRSPSSPWPADANADEAAASRAVYAPWLFRAPLRPPLAAAASGEQEPLTRAELGRLQGRELAAGRAAMTAFVGVAAACALTGRGPVTLLLEHLADPRHATVVRSLAESSGGGGSSSSSLGAAAAAGVVLP